MQRKVFDVLASAGGLILVVVLLVAGGLMTWGYAFTSSSVHSQLARQDIVFPSKAAFAQAKASTEVTPAMIPYLAKYAGEPLTTGAQAEAYADHFIAVHLSEMPYGGVYAKVSGAAMANPNNKVLAAEVQTTFQGTTLRGLLLEAYAFSQFGLIALYGAIASFVLAGLMALLVAFGFWHARRTPEDDELAVHVEAERVLADN
jgi:predicted lipid-binding transport protein (Tim44 family)